MSFWHELKRRSVVKVATAYAAVAWLSIQVAATVFPILSVPAGGVRLVTVLALAGFPIAVALAWIYEITPSGIRRADNVASAELAAGAATGRGFYLAVIGASGIGCASRHS